MKHIIFFLILQFPIFWSQSSAQTYLTLQECRERALQSDEQMKAADLAEKQAKLNRKIAFARYLPWLDGQATGIYRNDIGIYGVDLKMHGALLAGLTLTQPIYQGGKITAANRLARIGEDVSHEQKRQTRAQLLYDVDNAYYTLIATRAQVAMLESYVKQMQQLYADVKLCVDNGLAIQNDLLRIENEQSQTELLLTRARNGSQVCRMVLASLIGADLDDNIVPADTFNLTTVQPYNRKTVQPQTDISQRPEVALLQYSIAAAEQQVKISRAALLPSLGLQVGYSGFANVHLKGQLQTFSGDVLYLDQHLHKSSPMVALALKVPIFHWGAEWRNVQKAKMDVERARLDYENKSKKMTVELRQAELNLVTSDEMVETAHKSLAQADENLRVMRERFQVQLATLTDLLDAESCWRRAATSLIDALTQQRIYMTDYLRVTGQL